MILSFLHKRPTLLLQTYWFFSLKPFFCKAGSQTPAQELCSGLQPHSRRVQQTKPKHLPLQLTYLGSFSGTRLVSVTHRQLPRSFCRLLPFPPPPQHRPHANPTQGCPCRPPISYWRCLIGNDQEENKKNDPRVLPTHTRKTGSCFV